MYNNVVKPHRFSEVQNIGKKRMVGTSIQINTKRLPTNIKQIKEFIPYLKEVIITS